MRSERAKIFAPFSPLKGLDAAYREKERVIVQRSELLCDRVDEINIKLQSIRSGDVIEVTYYFDGGYQKKQTEVRAVLADRKLLIAHIPISFFDIYDIELIQQK